MKKQKMEFSKKIYLLNVGLVIFVVMASFVIIALSGRLGMSDLSPLSVICTASFSELAIHSGFYSVKAKAENVLKIGKQIREENLDIATINTANQVMNSNFENSI